MSVSLAELNSRVFLGLEAAGEYLQLDKIHNYVIQHLNVLTMQSRTSSVDVLLGVSDEFTPTDVTTNITSLIGKGVPSWIETRYQPMTTTQSFWWAPIRVVPFVQMNDFRTMGSFCCSFYSEELNSPTAEQVQYVLFSYLPAAVCRIRFQRDIVRQELDAVMLLPDRFGDLVVMKTENSVIPRVKQALALGLRRDEEGRKDAALILATLSEIYAQNLIDIRPLELEWRNWAYRDRAEQTSFNKPTPGGRGLYGNWGIGYGGFGGYGNGY